MIEEATSKEESAALAQLGGTGKRQKIHDAQIVFKLPKPVKALIQEYAGNEEVSDGQVIRWALAEYFEKRGIK